MSKVKILVVEDNHIISEEIKLKLESLNYEVCGIADRGRQAIDKTKKFKPNLVLMDIVLTDDLRKYLCENLAPGSLTFTAEKQGYTSSTLSVQVQAGITIQADIILNSN